MNRKRRRAQAARNRRGRGYLAAVLEEGMRIRAAGGPPDVFHVFVHHDAWCDFLNRHGECNCSPAISSRPDRVN
jgi:hypothetical protein